MPAKKKTKRAQTKSRTFAASKKPMKKTAKKRLAVKAKASKKLAKKKEAQKKAALTTNATRNETTAVKTAKETKRQLQDKNPAVYALASSRAKQERVFSGRQSGDLQGLSRAEGADSESVDELLDEGNPFEADVVAGVEDAENADEQEVRTHEVPEDDVPEEYLDKEK